MNNNIDKFLFDGVRLVVVSKNRTEKEILDIYNQNILDFGENKVQELIKKWENLPKNIRWHFLGHLQTNKVKYIVPFISIIQSVDSLKLLKEINIYAEKNNRVVDFLFQIKIAQEETKYGLEIDEVLEILNKEEYLKYKNVNLVGLMGMATSTKSIVQIKKEYQKLKEVFKICKNLNKTIKILSMGMSSDYKEAIENGSTMIRLGSVIFQNQ